MFEVVKINFLFSFRRHSRFTYMLLPPPPTPFPFQQRSDGYETGVSNSTVSHSVSQQHLHKVIQGEEHYDKWCKIEAENLSDSQLQVLKRIRVEVSIFA